MFQSFATKYFIRNIFYYVILYNIHLPIKGVVTAMGNISNLSNLRNADKVKNYGSSQQHHLSL